MAKQQSKRRRKRYAPGSAYAGDVRPTGILGVLSSRRLMVAIFLLMALALAAGGASAIFSGGLFTGSSSQQDDFVIQDENDAGTPTAEATPVRERYVSLPAMSIDPQRSYVATIKTASGDIQVRLFADRAPQAVNNFVFLAREDFYDGLTFDQVYPGFSAEAGNPGDGSGPVYDLPQENSGTYDKGTLGMASASVFFIALSDSEGDLRQYEGFTPLGQITGGLDVAERLTQGTEIEDIEISEG